jgi:hypothetical protein
MKRSILPTALLFASLLFLSGCDAEEPPLTEPEPQYPIVTRTLWQAAYEDLTGLIDEETCYPYPGAKGIDPDTPLMLLRRYTDCKGFNVTADVPLEYWYLKELYAESKEETWLCVAHGRGDMHYYIDSLGLVFEDKANFIYPSDKARLNLNFALKIAQRDRPQYGTNGVLLPHFTEESIVKAENRVHDIIFYCKVECINNDGEVVAHLVEQGVDKGMNWFSGVDPSGGGSMTVLVAPSGWLPDPNNGLHNSTWHIQRSSGSYTAVNGDGVYNIPMPPIEGYIRWTINVCDGFMELRTGGPYFGLWALLINDVEITTTDASNKYDT